VPHEENPALQTRLKYVDPARRRSAFTRAYAAIGTTRLGQLISRHVFWKLDPRLLRMTGGHLSMALVIRTAVLETRGAKSGSVRRNAVIYFHDGDRVTIVASNAGSARHPAWYHNLRAHPDVTLAGIPMRATVVTDEPTRERLWALADRVFWPFATYRRDAAKANRTIPIVQLTSR
jgi:deazaflavin-dependent oxidoreductase (nitroreductase family)